MQNISKRLIVAIIVLIITIVAGGWFWYASVREPGEVKQQQEISQAINVSKSNIPLTSDTLESYEPQYIPPQEFFSTADDTSNWETYRNEEFGFEVKYPKKSYGNYCNQKTYDCEWVVTETDLGLTTSGMDGAHAFYFGEKGSLSGYPNGITITVWKKDFAAESGNQFISKPLRQNVSIQKTDGASGAVYAVFEKRSVEQKEAVDDLKYAYVSSSGIGNYEFDEMSNIHGTSLGFIQSFRLIETSR